MHLKDPDEMVNSVDLTRLLLSSLIWVCAIFSAFFPNAYNFYSIFVYKKALIRPNLCLCGSCSVTIVLAASLLIAAVVYSCVFYFIPCFICFKTNSECQTSSAAGKKSNRDNIGINKGKKMYRMMDGWLAILCPFQHYYFSHIRMMGG